MNAKRYVIASIAAGVWLLLYGFVANAVILQEFWVANTDPATMRPEPVMPAVVASCFLQAFALGFIFVKGHENRGIGEGLRFGLLVAWFVAALYLLFYALQPWTVNGTLVAMITDGIMYVLAGVILAAVYKH